MKEIKAYIQPHRLSGVVAALSRIEGLTGLSVSKIQGFGRGRAREQPRRIVEDQIEYVPHLKLELCCRDDLVEVLVSTIQAEAHTGLKGDGKIYVSELVDACRIRTGERGSIAV